MIHILKLTFYIALSSVAYAEELNHKSTRYHYEYSPDESAQFSIKLKVNHQISDDIYRGWLGLPDDQFPEPNAIMEVYHEILVKLINKHNPRKLQILIGNYGFSVFSPTLKTYAANHLESGKLYKLEELDTFLTKYITTFDAGKALIKKFKDLGYEVRGTSDEMKIRVHSNKTVSIYAASFGLVATKTSKIK